MIEVVVRYMLEKIPSSTTSSTASSTSSAISCSIEPAPLPNTGRRTLQSRANTNKIASVAAPPSATKTVAEKKCDMNGSLTAMKVVAENESDKNGSLSATKAVAENEANPPNGTSIPQQREKMMSDVQAGTTVLNARKLNDASNGGDFTISTAVARRVKLPSDPKVNKHTSQQKSHFRERETNPPVSQSIAPKYHQFRPRSVAEWEAEQEKKRREESRNKTFVGEDYNVREKGKGRGIEDRSRRGRSVGEVEEGERETERGRTRSTVEVDKGKRTREGDKKTKDVDRSKTELEAAPTSMRHWHSAGDVDIMTGSPRENPVLRSSVQMVAHTKVRHS